MTARKTTRWLAPLAGHSDFPPDPVAGRYADLLALPMTETERTAIDALVEHGSQNAAAAALGWKRTKLQSRLRSVQARAKAAAAVRPEPPPVRGNVAAPKANDLYTEKHLADSGVVARYILTSAQNNTPVHPQFLANLEAFAEHIGARIMVSRFTYNKAMFTSKKSTKPGKAATASDTEELWYDPRIEFYVCDDPERHGSCRWQLAPDLLWCAEMNILPTAVNPLSGLESYAGPCSGIFPHTQIALDPVPVVGDREPKFNYTTGAVTQRNYISKKEGLKGEFHHCYGALLVEVDLVTGHWWARQLNAEDDGTFYDLTRCVKNGEVTDGHNVLAINWGDIHASEIDPIVKALNWDQGGVLDTLRPIYQFCHDTESFRNRSHHELKSFEKRYQKWLGGNSADSVDAETKITAELLAFASRYWCRTIVVSSNHDRHGERWLDDVDYKQDLPNAEFFLEAQLARVRALQQGKPFQFLQWAVERHWLHYRDCGVEFLERDQSFLIGPPGHEIECGQHGDEGPDGTRGNPAGFTRMAVRGNFGHIHRAVLRKGGAWAGVCSRRLPYSHGPSSWSVSDIATYKNGKRAILTMRDGKKWLQ